jgi:hypothetical protein
MVRRKLPKQFLRQLASVAETGMGYQVVTLVMRDGSQHPGTMVLNGETALVPDGLDMSALAAVKAGHLGRRCPPGSKLDRRTGRCVREKSEKKGKGIRALREAPEYAIVLNEMLAGEVMKSKGSIIFFGPNAGTVPMPKDAHGKACYLIRKSGDGSMAVIGIVRPTILGDRKARISPLRKFGDARGVKLAQGAKGPVVRRRSLIFTHKETPKASGETESPSGETKPSDGDTKRSGDETLRKVLAETVGNPTADGGAHSHRLLRNEGRVFGQARHFHKFVLPDGRVSVTDPDGDHPHGLDGDLATEEGSEHEHALGLPPEMDQRIVKTKPGGKHIHPALTMETGFGGPHVHELELETDGKMVTLVSMTSEEEAMEMPGGPGDEPDGSPTTPEAILEIAGALGIKADGDVKGAIDEIMKQTSVQSVVLSKQRFRTLEEARSWIKENGFKDDKVDEKPNTFRFRQFPPGRCKRGTFRQIRPRGSRGVQFVICVPTGSVTPPGGLGRSEGGRDSTLTLGFSEDGIRKDVVEESSIRIHQSKTGFQSFVQQGDILFATDQKATGKASGKVVLLERQRMDGDAMDKAPAGTKDAILVEPAKGDPKKVAREHLGRRVFVMSRVGSRLVEEQVHLALIDPTKAEPCKV